MGRHGAIVMQKIKLPALQFHDPARQWQSKANPIRIPRVNSLTDPERLPNPGLILGRNAIAVVLDADRYRPVWPKRSHNAATVTAVMHEI